MTWLVLAACSVPDLAGVEIPFLGGGASAAAQDPNLPPSAWIEQSWPLRFAEESSLAPFAAHAGWVSLVMKRDYPSAVRDLGPVGKVDAARAHGEMAYLYRQAAVVAARAWVGAYAEGQRTDAAEHLLCVSYAILGQLDDARAADGRFDARDDVAAWHAPWREWLGSGASWPPDLRALPFDLPPPAVGALPEIGDLPHYTLVERNGDWRDVADPGALVSLALWHEVAAAAADGGAASGMRVARAGYRMGSEPTPALESELPVELLFGSDHLTAADASFAADLTGGDARAVIGAWSNKSVAAWLAGRATAGDRLDVPSVLTRVDALRDALRARADARTEGLALAHHATFADLGALGVTRTLALVAERLGDRKAAAALREAVRERSVRAGADPVSALALAAADVEGGAVSSARVQVEGLVERYPSLAAVLYALDAAAER